MIATWIIGTVGTTLLLVGLRLLFIKPVEGAAPPSKVPAIAVLAAAMLLIGTGMWGHKNPKKLEQLVMPVPTACPKVLEAGALQYLADEQATQFTGHFVEAGWCEYTFEFRSGRKLPGRADREPAKRQDAWFKLCGNHPLSTSPAEVWVKKVQDNKQLICFLTEAFAGAIWLEPEADALKWVRVLQADLPKVQ